MTPDRTRHRSRRDVLVAGAETLASIGVIRSLGRAGYSVHACSDDAGSLGFRSRFATTCVVHPDPYGADFVPWLRGYVREHDIRMIVPTETLLLAVRSVLSEFAPLLPVSRSADVLYGGFSKFDTLALLRAGECGEARVHLPPTLLVDECLSDPSDSDLALLGKPLYIKADGVHARTPARSVTLQAEGMDEARAQLVDVRRRFSRVVVQGHVPGQGVGVFFLVRDGKVVAEFMHRRLHEVPHTGGVSSLRESWYHGAIRDDALSKLRALKWEGVAMMEYRWDRRTGDFWFVEMNGRFWGSLHLAMFAGVDFPAILADAFFGDECPSGGFGYRLGLRCRHTFPKEAQYVWSRWKDRRLSIGRRVADIFEFALLSLDPRVRSDLSFAGDRSLWLRSLGRWLVDCCGVLRRGRRSRGRTSFRVEADPTVVQV